MGNTSYSRSNLASSTHDPSLSRAEHLIKSQQRSSRKIRRRENRDPDLHHRASRWLNIDKVVESAVRQSPSTISATETIDILAARWTTPRPHAQYLGPSTNAPAAAYYEVQRRRSPEIRELRAINTDLIARIVRKDHIIRELKFPSSARGVQYFQDPDEQGLHEIEDLELHNSRLYESIKVTEADFKRLQNENREIRKENEQNQAIIIRQNADYSELLARYNAERSRKLNYRPGH